MAPVTGFASGDAMAIDWQSRRDGFDHRRGKPTDRPINWKYWGSLQDWTQWDAFALSLNLNPENLEKSPNSWMAGPGRGPTFLSKSFPSQAIEVEFERRLTMFGRVIGGRPLATVSPAQFAAWCLHEGLEDLPPELVAMAEPKAAPVATPEPTAAPVVAESAEQRRVRWLGMFEAEEKREKRGALQRLANSEGVDRSNMGKDIAKARAERDTQRQAGMWTAQLVKDGKRLPDLPGTNPD